MLCFIWATTNSSIILVQVVISCRMSPSMSKRLIGWWMVWFLKSLILIFTTVGWVSLSRAKMQSISKMSYLRTKKLGISSTDFQGSQINITQEAHKSRTFLESHLKEALEPNFQTILKALKLNWERKLLSQSCNKTSLRKKLKRQTQWGTTTWVKALEKSPKTSYNQTREATWQAPNLT